MKTNSMALAQWLDVKEGKDSLAFKELERWDVTFGLVSQNCQEGNRDDVEDRGRPLMILQKIQAAILMIEVSKKEVYVD